MFDDIRFRAQAVVSSAAQDGRFGVGRAEGAALRGFPLTPVAAADDDVTGEHNAISSSPGRLVSSTAGI